MTMTRKLIAALAVLVVFAAACQTAEDPATTITTNNYFAAPAAAPGVSADDSWRTNPPSESYALRQIHIEMAKIVFPMWVELTMPAWGQGSYEQRCPINVYRWTPDDMTIPFGPAGENFCGGVYFAQVRYTPDSDIRYGQPRPDEGPFANVPDTAKRIDNRNGAAGGLDTFSEEHEVHQDVEHSQSSTFTLDVTVGTDTSIGGEYAGASFETSISTEVHTGLEKSKESTESMGESQTDTVEVEFEVPADSDTLFTFTNAPVTVRTDYDLDAFYDFEIVFYGNNENKVDYQNTHAGFNAGVSQSTWDLWSRYDYYHRCFATGDNPGWRDRKTSASHEYTEFRFSGLADLADMIAGTNVAWPRMGDEDCSLATGEQDNPAGYHGIWPGVGRAMDDASDPDVVHIKLTGTRVQTTASALTVKTYDLSGCPDGVADGIEANAENESGHHDSIFVVDGAEQTCQNDVDGVKSHTTREPTPDGGGGTTTTSTTSVPAGG